MGLEELLSGIAGRIAGGDVSPSPVAKHYLSVMGRFSAMAVKWAAVSSSGARCNLTVSTSRPGIFRCGVAAAGVCSSCAKFTCIEHAMVSPRTGSLVCEACIMLLRRPIETEQKAADVGLSEPVLRLGYLHILGLRDGATMDEIRSAYRRLAKENHPDKCGSNGDSMKLINEAHDWLKENQTEKAA